MKKWLKSLLSTMLVFMMIMGNYVEAAGDSTMKIIFVGNSITKHGPSEALGWTGNWGMAASSEDKDFVHQLVNMLKYRYGNVEFQVAGGSAGGGSFENIPDEVTDADIQKSLSGLFELIKAEKPDVINIHVGENWGAHYTTKTKVFDYFAKEAHKIAPDMIINLCVVFWSSVSGIDYEVKKEIADKYEHVYLSETCIAPNAFKEGMKNPEDNPYCAYDSYEGGVGAHPGDKGFQKMAEIIFETLSPELDKKFLKEESTSSSSGMFDDIAKHWAKSSIEFVVRRGLMSGTAERKFSPDAKLTRAMLAVILYNYAENPEVTYSGEFADVKAENWYADAISWLSEKGITKGYADGTFGPDDNITREQLAVFLHRYAGEAESEYELAFTDNDAISEYAKKAIAWAVENEMMSGKGENMLDPKGLATRAETAVMLYKFVIYMARNN